MKITDPKLQAKLARQIAATTGLQVQCGQARSAPTEQERDQYRP